jgi:hypothetical protein
MLFHRLRLDLAKVKAIFGGKFTLFSANSTSFFKKNDSEPTIILKNVVTDAN